MARSSLKWLGVAWSGLKWLGVAWSGLEWLGVAQSGLEWLGVARSGGLKMVIASFIQHFVGKVGRYGGYEWTIWRSIN